MEHFPDARSTHRLLVVFGGFWMVADPQGLARSAQTAGGNGADLTSDLFSAVITNMRVFRVHGVLSQSLATMPLSRILDITVRRPLHGRLLGVGHFCFESAAQEQGSRDIRYVARPYVRDLAIPRVVQRAGLRGGRVY